MLTLGLLALLSASIVPGAIVLSVTRCPLPLVPKAVAAFFISVAWTHLKVLALVATGSFETGTVLGLFVMECCALGWILRSNGAAAAPVRFHGWTPTILFAALLAFTLAAVTSTDRYGPPAFFSVWHFWDTVVSWNRWALDWAANRWPTDTWGYGQLLPTLWAYTYVFNFSRPVEFFAKALTDVFPLLIVVMHVDLILRRHVIAGIIGYLGLLYFANSPVGMWAFQALADIPLAASVLASVYFAHLASESESVTARTYACTLAILIAGVSAALKQQGLMLLLLCPILFWPFLPDQMKSLRGLWLPCLLAVLIAAPFYAVFAWSLAQDGESSNLRGLLGLTAELSGGAQVAARMTHASEIMTDAFGGYAVFIGLPILLLLYLVRLVEFRRFILLFLIPYLFVWAYGFSYDLRNSLLIYPLLSFFAALSIQSIQEKHRVVPGIARVSEGRPLPFPHRLPPAVPRNVQPLLATFGVLLAVLIIGQTVTDDEMNQRFRDAALGKGVWAVNQQLLKLAENGLLSGTVVTNYEVMRYLPQFAGREPIFKYIEEPLERIEVINDKDVDTVIVWRAPDSKADWDSFVEQSSTAFVVTYESAELTVISRAR